MSQQDMNKTPSDKFKRRLFIETGFGYTEIANSKGFDEVNSLKIARIVEEYSPPTPSFKVAEIIVLNSASKIHGSGKASYKINLRLIFPEKKFYNEFLFFASNQVKFYDENGAIFVGSFNEPPETTRIEAGKRYDVKLNIVAVKKESYEEYEECKFIDIDGYWAEKDIKEMAHAGLITQMDRNGNYVYTFNPEVLSSRAVCTAFLNRTRKYIERMIRG